MFTGLIQEVGQISSIKANSSGVLFTIKAPKLRPSIKIDDSIAVNGACLTATTLTNEGFTAQAVHITLEKTALKQSRIGSSVNLELALRVGDRLGGHFVQGHVNALAKVHSIVKLGGNFEYSFTYPAKLRRYFISEGSLAIDGVSLTIAKLSDSTLTVSLIPHTLENTSLGRLKNGDLVNIEVDMLAKYLENFYRFKDISSDKDYSNFLSDEAPYV